MRIPSKNKILISMPNVVESCFYNSVILLCEHNRRGATGIIINKKIDRRYNKALLPKSSSPNIFFGGPVLINKGFILHRSNNQTKNTIKLSSDFSITNYKNAKSIINKKNKIDYKLVFGHAGWSAGQLEGEIKRGDWLIQNTNPDFVFNIDYDKMWENATLSLGFESGSITTINARA